MLLDIASLQEPTVSTSFTLPRKPGQTFTDYLNAELERKAEYVRRKIITVTEEKNKQKNRGEYLFFTLPEFFWNTPWENIKNTSEILKLSDFYLKSLPKIINDLLKDIPAEKYGNIVLLPGTAAALVLVENYGAPFYEALNCTVVASNFKKTQSGYPEVSMWPKRDVSPTDFGIPNLSSWERSRVPEWMKGDGYRIFKLAHGIYIRVIKYSTATAEHYPANEYGPVLVDDLVPNCPFSINICLDHSAGEPAERNEEIKNTQPKIDFLITCGMSFRSNVRYGKTIQYAVRNDGIGSGACQTKVVHDGKIHNIPAIPVRIFDTNIHMTSIDIK